jgi:ankyrin repeat protein
LRRAVVGGGIAEVLLSAGADKDAKDKDGETPLRRAAESGHKECVELLLSAGADKDAKNNDGWTPLHHAAAARAQ